MTVNGALKSIAPAAGAYLGVTAASYLGKSGIVGAIAGVAGAWAGLYLAAQIA